jgi:hypothetical protein
MKLILGMIFASCLSLAANAYEIKMTQGKDSYIFDMPDVGKPISVYQIDENEPYSDQMEGLMHDRFIMEDILKAIPELQEHPLNFWNGRSIDPSVNAFAAIRLGRRYIVLNPAWIQDHYARIFILGHELGHHICGHTAGIMRDQPWEKELEADRFAGMIIRAMERSGNGSYQVAINNAMEVLSEYGSATHLPRSMRINATLQGYNYGSPCVGRRWASAEIPTTGTYSGGSAPSLWSHNGSVMRLIADGASRKFIYESPRSGLESAGIKTGTVLFSGQKNGDTYFGTAYEFSRNCGAVAFQVSGPIGSDQRSVTVSGKVPSRDSSCRVVDYRDETLIFVFTGD